MLRTNILPLVAAWCLALPHSQQGAPSPPPVVDPNQRLEIRFASKKDVQPLKLETKGGKLVIAMTVNGRAARAVIDSGSQRSLIDKAFAQSLSLQPSGSLDLISISGIPTKSPIFAGVRADIPNQITSTAPVVGADLSGLARATGEPIRFVLGSDFLNNASYAIDLKNGVFVIRPPGALRTSGAGVKVIPLLDGQFVSACFAKACVKLKPDSGVVDPILIEPHAWGNIASTVTAARTSNVTGADGRAVRTVSGDAAQITIGEETFAATVKKLPKDGVSHGADGLLGLSFFKDSAALFDARAGTITLSRQGLALGKGLSSEPR